VTTPGPNPFAPAFPCLTLRAQDNDAAVHDLNGLILCLTTVQDHITTANASRFGPARP